MICITRFPGETAPTCTGKWIAMSDGMSHHLTEEFGGIAFSCELANDLAPARCSLHHVLETEEPVTVETRFCEDCWTQTRSYERSHVRTSDRSHAFIPRIYVSGPSRELDRCIRAMERIQELGAANAYDWTAEIIRQGVSTPESPEAQLEAALADLNAVAHCDAVLFLDGENPSPGRWVELGAAWGRGKPIVGSRAPGLREYLWHRLLSLEFSTDEEACQAVIEVARRVMQR